MFIESFKLLGRNLKIIVPTLISIVISFVMIFFIVLSFIFNSVDLFSYGDFFPDATYILSILRQFFGTLFIYSIIFFLLGTFINCWTVTMSVSSVKDESYTIGESFKKSAKYFLRVLGIQAIYVGIAILAVIIIAMLAIISRDAMGVFVFLLFVLTIGGLFLIIILTPVVYITINDDLTISDGFKKGVQFSIDNFLNLLGVNAIIFGILFLIGILTTIPTLTGSSPSGFLQLLSQILNLALSLARGIYILMLYNKNGITKPEGDILEANEENALSENYVSPILDNEELKNKNVKPDPGE